MFMAGQGATSIELRMKESLTKKEALPMAQAHIAREVYRLRPKEAPHRLKAIGT